jgi:hypothetical protein
MNGRSSSRTPRLILAVRPCRFRVGGRVIFSNEDFLMTVPFHPHADIFPMMTPQEQMGLADDIRAHGLRNKIVVHEGAILDGRNRYQACLMAGVDPAFDEFDDSGADALNFVMSLNMHRRHLTDGERATAAAKLANIRFGDHQHTFGVCKFADPRHLSILGRQEVRCIDSPRCERGQGSQGRRARACRGNGTGRGQSIRRRRPIGAIAKDALAQKGKLHAVARCDRRSSEGMLSLRIKRLRALPPRWS